MGIIQRFKDIMASNINDLIDKAENPEKIAKLELEKRIDMLAECKNDTAEVMAAETAAERELDKVMETAAKYEEIAKKALIAASKAENEAKAKEANDDAAKAVAEKQKAEALIPTLQANYERAAEASEQMKQLTKKLTDDISDLETRIAKISSTMKVAKAQEAVNKTDKYNTGNSDDRLSKMEAKAQAKLDKTTAALELSKEQNTAKSLEEKYGEGSASSVDDELAKLRESLGL